MLQPSRDSSITPFRWYYSRPTAHPRRRHASGTVMASFHHASGPAPVKTSATGPLKPTHPTGLLKFYDPTAGGPCVDDDAASTSATTGRRAARRLRVGLEAGNCGEGLACLFQAHAVFSHQTCADGSVFFRRRLSKAGLSGYAHHLWLVPDPDSQPWQVPGRAGAKTGMTGRGPETASQKAGFI